MRNLHYSEADFWKGISNAKHPEVERQLSASQKPIRSVSGEEQTQKECNRHCFFFKREQLKKSSRKNSLNIMILKFFDQGPSIWTSCLIQVPREKAEVSLMFTLLNTAGLVSEIKDQTMCTLSSFTGFFSVLKIHERLDLRNDAVLFPCSCAS